MEQTGKDLGDWKENFNCQNQPSESSLQRFLCSG